MLTSVFMQVYFQFRTYTERRPQSSNGPVCLLYKNSTCKGEISPDRAIKAESRQDFLFKEKKLRGEKFFKIQIYHNVYTGLIDQNCSLESLMNTVYSNYSPRKEGSLFLIREGGRHLGVGTKILPTKREGGRKIMQISGRKN